MFCTVPCVIGPLLLYQKIIAEENIAVKIQKKKQSSPCSEPRICKILCVHILRCFEQNVYGYYCSLFDTDCLRFAVYKLRSKNTLLTGLGSKLGTILFYSARECIVFH